MNIGNKNISKLYFGDKEINKVFLGNYEVYSSEPYITTITVTVNEFLPLHVWVSVRNVTRDYDIDSIKISFDTDTAQVVHYGEDEGYQIEFTQSGTYHIYIAGIPYTDDQIAIGYYDDEGDSVSEYLNICGVKNLQIYTMSKNIILDDVAESLTLRTRVNSIYFGKNMQTLMFSERGYTDAIDISSKNAYLKKFNYSIYKQSSGKLFWYSPEETAKTLIIKDNEINNCVLSKNNYLENLVIQDTVLDTRLYSTNFSNLKRVIIRGDSVLKKPNCSIGSNYQDIPDNDAKWFTDIPTKPDTWYQDTRSYRIICRFGVMTYEDIDITGQCIGNPTDYYQVYASRNSRMFVDFRPDISNSSTTSQYYTNNWLYLNSDIWPQSVICYRCYTKNDAYNTYSTTISVSDQDKIRIKRIYIGDRYMVVRNGVAPYNDPYLKAIFIPENSEINNINNTFNYPNAIIFAESKTEQSWSQYCNVREIRWGSTQADFWEYDID